MNFKKLLSLVLTLTLSCKKQHVQNVWFCDNDETYILNGNVKEVVIGDRHNYYKVYFSEKGDLQYSQKKDSDVWIDDKGKHFQIYAYNANYSTLHDNKGNKIALIRTYVGDTIKSKWGFDNKGRVIGYAENINNPSFCTSPYKYDNKGNLVEYKHIFGMMMAEPDVYQYKSDRNHMIVESRLYEAAYIRKENFQYIDFDSNGNWTKRIDHSQSFAPAFPRDTTFTITRKITYY